MEISIMKKLPIPAAFKQNILEMHGAITIAFMGEKGGGGKSNGASSLNNALNNAGIKSRLIDCDVQSTSYAQFAKRQITIDSLIANEEAKLAGNFKNKAAAKIAEYEAMVQYEVVRHPMNSNFESLFKMAVNDGYKVIIVDTPCHLTEDHANLMKACDIVIFPFNNSDDDFNSNTRVSRFIQKTKEFAKSFNTKIFSVITDQSTVTEVRNQEIEEEWSNFNSTHPLLKKRLKNRQICRDVKRSGLGVAEVPGKYAQAATEEILSVFIEAVERTFEEDETSNSEAA